MPLDSSLDPTDAAEVEAFLRAFRVLAERAATLPLEQEEPVSELVSARLGLPAAGLILLSYPLHPPGRPDKLRVEHLPHLSVPCLFVTGDRDPFGSPSELEAATAVIPGPVTHHWITGGRHDVKGADEEICSVVRAWVDGL